MREPAPRNRCYFGYRDPHTQDVTVVRAEADGTRSPLDPRYDLRNHSPAGFNWGYGGSGPAQLALALVADASGDDALALKVYQRFKFEIVGGMADQWMLEAGNIADFAKTLTHLPEEQL